MSATLCACVSKPADTHMDITYDPCAGVVIAASGANDSELESIDLALAMWRDVVAQALLSRTEQPGFSRLQLMFADAPAALRGVYDDETGVVYVNQHLVNPRSRAITVAHELGHAFGLFHVGGRDSVMNPANLEFVPNAEDAANIRELWPACREENDLR